MDYSNRRSSGPCRNIPTSLPFSFEASSINYIHMWEVSLLAGELNFARNSNITCDLIFPWVCIGYHTQTTLLIRTPSFLLDSTSSEFGEWGNWFLPWQLALGSMLWFFFPLSRLTRLIFWHYDIWPRHLLTFFSRNRRVANLCFSPGRARRLFLYQQPTNIDRGVRQPLGVLIWVAFLGRPS